MQKTHYFDATGPVRNLGYLNIIICRKKDEMFWIFFYLSVEILHSKVWVAEYLHLYKRRLNVQKFVLLTWQFDILRSDQDPEKGVDPTGSGK